MLVALVTTGVAVGLAVAFAECALLGVAAGFGSAAVVAVILAVASRGGRATHWVAEAMRRISGR